MNRSFQNYVTGQAFVLALSKPQIEALRWLAWAKSAGDYDTVPLFMSVAALKRKGLVSGTPPRVTEEGWLVLQLCCLAGLTTIGETKSFKEAK